MAWRGVKFLIGVAALCEIDARATTAFAFGVNAIFGIKRRACYTCDPSFNRHCCCVGSGKAGEEKWDDKRERKISFFLADLQGFIESIVRR
jgi:hypothetical protein